MIPPTLAANPLLSRWVTIEADRIAVAFGKVEYGQGVVTALAQIAAEELDVPLEKLRIVTAATGAVPDEGLTVGSMSIESSGASVRAACAEVRMRFVDHAAAKHGCQPAELEVVGGAFYRGDEPLNDSYWTLALAVDLDVAPSGEARWKHPGQHRLVGQNVPRLDLPAKVFGGGFIQDLEFPDLLHARILRQPGPGARLGGLDEAAARRAAGEADLDILVDNAFVAFLSRDEWAAAAAHAAVEVSAQWVDSRDVRPVEGTPEHLTTLPDFVYEVGDPEVPSNRRQLSARYSRPYISHGSLSPSCGIARYESGLLEVWTHAQGVYPLRVALERITGLAAEQIDVEHVHGAGNYGNNGADDAAYDAAVCAMRRPGQTVRVQWRREDEFGYAPCGTAMVQQLTAQLDEQGRLVDWTSELWSGPHPNRGRSLAELALKVADAAPSADPAPPPDPAALLQFSGGRLNSIPAYDIPAKRAREHLVRRTPIKVSSLRGLGGPPNIFAAECFVDELAEAAGVDPLRYRLQMQSDPRAIAVLERTARLCDWSRRASLPENQGLGLAYDRHRDRAAYCAVACELHVDEAVRLDHLWCVADCGLIINPDGARNQLEGGMIMAASWALKEEVKLGGNGITSLTWNDYPILRFDEVPEIDVELIVPPGAPPWGAGEISQGATMAAIGNALAQALGTRVRSMPFSRERLAEALIRD